MIVIGGYGHAFYREHPYRNRYDYQSAGWGGGPGIFSPLPGWLAPDVVLIWRRRRI